MTLPRSRVFYGWWIVVASAVILMVDAGLGFYAFGVFLTPLTREFGWSRAEFSGTISVAFLIAGMASPVAGSLTDRFGARRVMVGAALVMGGSFVFLGLTQTLWYFYLLFVVEAVARAGAHVVPITTIIANWFQEKRGLAMGITVTGISIGGVVITPLATYLVDLAGWRLAYAILGLLIWLTVIPLSVLVIRNRPGDVGLTPYGAGTADEGENHTARAARRTGAAGPSWTAGAAIRTRAFWFASVSVSLLFMGGTAVMAHTIPLLRDRGASAEGAALVLSFIAGMGIIGKMSCGYLADRLQVRFVVVLISIATALGITLLLAAGKGPTVWLFAFVFGVSFGGVIAVQSLLAAYCFGLASLGVILGAVAMVANLGFVAGPLLAGYVFDVTGSYDLALKLYIGGCLLAGLLGAFVHPPSLPQAVERQL
ncbi:MAG: MFS transporter [Chloroflexi bacterium]|nr:MFS transporter [Chloroflexota bacterium]